jgi:hypothetical protein
METSKPSNGLSMTYATSAPATAGGQAGSPVRMIVIVGVLGRGISLYHYGLISPIDNPLPQQRAPAYHTSYRYSC